MRDPSLAVRFAVLLLAIAAPGFPATYTRGPGLDLSVLDDGYDGSLGSMTCDTVNVLTTGTVGSVALRVQMSHTFVGDLTIKLRSPGATLVTVMSRPLLGESADDGSGSGGAGADLDIAYPVDFSAEAVFPAEVMGMGLVSADVVCLEDGICAFQPANGAAAPGTFADFVGAPVTGGWNLCIADSAEQDVGALDGWTLFVEIDLFADGFELGNPCAWSHNSGGPACP